MKNAYKSLIYGLIIATISSCTKEIKVVKGPATNDSSYNGFALFSVGSNPLNNTLQIFGPNDSKLYSLDLTGKETEIKDEDGNLFQNVSVTGFKPVKSGLIFGLRKDVYDSVLDTTNTIYNIYFTADGLTAKKISENNQIFSNEGSYKVPTSTNGFNYLCTVQGVLEWNDADKSLLNVHAFEPNVPAYCYGQEIGNEFFSILREYTLDTVNSYFISKPLKFVKFYHKDSAAQMTVLRDQANIENYTEGDIYNFTKIDDEILFVERYSRPNQPPFMGIRKVNNNTLESSIVFESDSVYNLPGTYWANVNMLFRGDTVNNKLYMMFERGYLGDTVDLLEENTQTLLQSNTFHVTSKLLSYTKSTGLVELSSSDTTFGYTEYVRSGDKVFTLRYEPKAFYYEGSTQNYYTDNHLRLLDETAQNLVYDFGIRSNINTTEIQKNGVVIITDYENRSTTLNPKLTVYSLPNLGQGVLSDSRFDLQKYRYVNFTDFYNKTLFQYSLFPEVGQPPTDNSKIGFFGSDGEIHIIEKDNANLNSMMMK